MLLVQKWSLSSVDDVGHRMGSAMGGYDCADRHWWTEA